MQPSQIFSPEDLRHSICSVVWIQIRDSSPSSPMMVGILKILEWPGLWNGAMAYWNTVFVEVPLTIFNPVKTVLDL